MAHDREMEVMHECVDITTPSAAVALPTITTPATASTRARPPRLCRLALPSYGSGPGYGN
jgi:hypothetical protein